MNNTQKKHTKVLESDVDWMPNEVAVKEKTKIIRNQQQRFVIVMTKRNKKLQSWKLFGFDFRSVLDVRSKLSEDFSMRS